MLIKQKSSGSIGEISVISHLSLRHSVDYPLIGRNKRPGITFSSFTTPAYSRRIMNYGLRFDSSLKFTGSTNEQFTGLPFTVPGFHPFLNPLTALMASLSSSA